MILMFTERMRDTDLVRSFFMSDRPGALPTLQNDYIIQEETRFKKNEQKNFESAAVFSDL